MLLSVVDANGAPQQVAVPSPGTAADGSGPVAPNLPLGGPFTYQVLLPAVAVGAVRGGWFIVNRATNPMYVTEDGSVPGPANIAASVVYPGQMFPPPGVGYPITQGVIYVAGTIADPFGSKNW